MRLKRCLLTTAVLAGLVAAFMGATSARADDWRLVRDEDGVRVHMRREPGSPFQAFRASAKIRAPFERLLAVMADTPNNCLWMHGCGRSLVLKQLSLTERYVYQVNQVPAPLWPRDMIMHSRARINAARDEVTISLSAAPRFCDGEKLPACKGRDQQSAAADFVRIERAEGFYRLRKLDDNLVEVTWQMHAEPGGDISGWMADFGLADIPLKTLSALRNHTERLSGSKTRLDLARYAAAGDLNRTAP